MYAAAARKQSVCNLQDGNVNIASSALSWPFSLCFPTGFVHASPTTFPQDLMDIMYDQTFWVVKEELPVTLPFESMIFVMEDIDAQSPIVRCRSHPLGKRRTRRQFDVRGPAKRRTQRNYAIRTVPETEVADFVAG